MTATGRCAPVTLRRLLARAASRLLLLAMLSLAGCNDEDSSYYSDTPGDGAPPAQNQANGSDPNGAASAVRPRAELAQGAGFNDVFSEIDGGEKPARLELIATGNQLKGRLRVGRATYDVAGTFTGNTAKVKYVGETKGNGELKLAGDSLTLNYVNREGRVTNTTRFTRIGGQRILGRTNADQEAERRRREQQAIEDLEAMGEDLGNASKMAGMWTSIDDEGYKTVCTVKVNGAALSAQAISPDVVITMQGTIDNLGTANGTWTQRGVNGDARLNLSGTFRMFRELNGNLYLETQYILGGQRLTTRFNFVRQR